MRGRLVAISVLIALVMISSPAQAQEETEEDNVIIDIVLPLALAFIMFSLGLGLNTSDFAFVFNEPKAFGIGIVNQMLVLPLVGFTIATIAALDGELAVGLMILACCPGGVTSNILTKLAKGDTALSISYTAVVSVVSVITLPLVVGFSMDHFMGEAAPSIDIIGLGITMFLLTTLPVAIGMAIRAAKPNTADSVSYTHLTLPTILLV